MMSKEMLAHAQEVLAQCDSDSEDAQRRVCMKLLVKPREQLVEPGRFPCPEGWFQVRPYSSDLASLMQYPAEQCKGFTWSQTAQKWLPCKVVGWEDAPHAQPSWKQWAQVHIIMDTGFSATKRLQLHGENFQIIVAKAKDATAPPLPIAMKGISCQLFTSHPIPVESPLQSLTPIVHEVRKMNTSSAAGETRPVAEPGVQPTLSTDSLVSMDQIMTGGVVMPTIDIREAAESAKRFRVSQ